MKYQICVSAAARGKSVEDGRELAEATGRTIAGEGHILLTGATRGLPYCAAQGAVQAGGQSIGFSPAASREAHVRSYQLPDDMYDVVLYTGLNYVGRDNLLVNCADAVVIIGGRLGTTHEFTVAMETHKPVAILHGAGGTSQLFDELLQASGKDPRQLIEATEASVLLRKVEQVLDEKNERLARHSS